jgi:hypothetical protein
MIGPETGLAFSNGIRLTGREWLVVGLVTIVLLSLTPAVWERLESFPLEADYRIPHELTYDYWLYEEFARLAADQYETMLIGDSVIWGEYVTREETLAHYLNGQSGQERYANLGLDGAHPLALRGLVAYYAGSITRKNVVLQCNPLWLSSRRRDLQDEQYTDFNHPRLIPQFVPHIPSYREEISPRIGVLVEQLWPVSQWTAHLQQAYYDKADIPSWTLAHPYDNPLEPLTHGLPASDQSRRPPSVPWYKDGWVLPDAGATIVGLMGSSFGQGHFATGAVLARKRNNGITPQDYPWIDLETSLQWQAFREVVDLLRQRGNRVFVLIGPFNEHLLTPASKERYQKVKATIAAWLTEQEVDHLVAPPLSRDQYGDASHPLAAGYAALARRLQEEAFFRTVAPAAEKR